jgi:glucokinase
MHQAGLPGDFFRFMHTDKKAIGVDIGGNHIKSAAVDLSGPTIIQDSVALSDIDNHAPAEAILNVWSRTIRETIQAVGLENLSGIGFGMPGPFDYVKGIALFEKVFRYDGLYGINVLAGIRDRLLLPEQFHVRFINDATAFAIGEAWLGKGAAYDRVVALTLGSGFGSAFLKGGLPVVTGDQVPEIGAVWHLPFKDGIAVDYISTNWFVKEYQKISGKNISGVKDLVQIYEDSKEVRGIFQEYGRNLGNILLPWLKKFKAEILILGGNIMGAYSLFQDELWAVLDEGSVMIKIEISELKEDAAILGSARLMDEAFHKKVFPTLPYM